MFRRLPVLAVLAAFSGFALDGIYGSPPLTPPQRERLLGALERRWESFQDPSPQMGVRSLFEFALESAEADHGLERLGGALERAERMQDRDPESRTYGNFRWYWGAERPEDLNAVEFSMQDAALLWMRHRERLPEDALERLERLISFAVEGIRRHNVRESYTNIFLMKTWNCIALGEQTERPELAREGYAMLDAWLLYTWEHGVHEYLSPTYYGTDLDSLLLIAAFSRDSRARSQAETALRLFWTDIAANWFEPCLRLGGAHSRDYDYVTGHGYLDHHLRFAGWLEPHADAAPLRFAALTGWRPPGELRTLAVERLPRMVRQRWGAGAGERAAQYVGRSVSLGSAGASYADPMDKTLTVHFAGGPGMPVVSFLMDARNDPYGRLRNPVGGGHSKALHLTPFLMSVQREREALLLAAISPGDRGFQRPAPDPVCLLSHVVLPREGVALWVGDEPVAAGIEAGPAESLPGAEVRELLRDTGLGAVSPWRRLWTSRFDAATPGRAFEIERAVHIESPFRVERDARASGGRFVWKPGAPGEVGPGGGRALIPLQVPEAGSYYLLARILSPTPSEDSFQLRIRKGTRDLLPLSDWHTGVHADWTWQAVCLSPGEPTAIELPAGTALLELLCREDGTKIDRILLTDRRRTARPVPLDRPVFARHGDAAAGFRIVHAADMRGGPATVELRTDVAASDAMTLTVIHAAGKPESGRASVALWTRVAESLDEAGFARFRSEFAQASASAAFDGTTLEVTAQGIHAPLRLRANLETYDRQVCAGEEPGAAEALLAVDGRDLGREILAAVDPIAAYRELLESLDSGNIGRPDQPFEAEDAAFLLWPFQKGADPAASGGAFVWQPGEPGLGGGSSGARALIPFLLPAPGPYYLWARVQAPTPDDDSFRIRIRQGADERVPASDWHTGVHTAWEWVPAELGAEKQRALDLPEGLVLIEILCREDGTKIDQIWLTADAERTPR
ncbi:MAG: hypothetical protein JXR77_01655 [Lentisphaeria bacterium]|nr:hypothetical protein [Lentisphaeria bacterium]